MLNGRSSSPMLRLNYWVTNREKSTSDEVTKVCKTGLFSPFAIASVVPLVEDEGSRITLDYRNVINGSNFTYEVSETVDEIESQIKQIWEDYAQMSSRDARPTIASRTRRERGV